MLMTNYEMDMTVEPGRILISHNTDAYIDVLELKRMLLSAAGAYEDNAVDWLEVEDRLVGDGRSELTIRSLSEEIDDYTMMFWLSSMRLFISDCCTQRTFLNTEIHINFY